MYVISFCRFSANSCTISKYLPSTDFCCCPFCPSWTYSQNGPKQKGRAPQDLLGLDLDADPRRRDPPNHLVATNSSPSCGMDDRGLLRWIKIFRTPGESSPNFKKSQIFEIDVPYPNFMFRFHVRSTRVPSEKQT